MEMAFCLTANYFKRVFYWFNSQLKRIWIEKTKLFFEFSEIKKFFLTFFIDMMLMLYIDQSGFLFDRNAIQKSGFIVFPQFKWICSQKTKLCFLSFLNSKNFF